jgi:Carboxypeptidase regulatory-like domain
MAFRRRLLLSGTLVFAFVFILPLVARAQSGIAGVVKDTTGSVLPGVTVEATSPVLIEKSRTVVTDEAGLYKIVDLRPGTYAITFTLTGFSSFRRDGVELPANFTATINADLRVGSIEETVTVSGQSPIVDVQSAAQQQILPRAVIDAVPTGKAIWSIAALVPGLTLSGIDVGGSRGMQQLTMAVHGSDARDTVVQVDGMMLNSFQDNVQTYYNDQMFEEMNYQTGAIGAETQGAGVRLNMIPKEGGNTFKGTLYYSLQPGQWVGDNTTPELLERGLVAPGKTKINRDLSGSIGGPVFKDKLWFFFSARRWGVDQYINNAFYNVDPTHRTWRPDSNQQVVDNNLIKSGVLRLTYRAGPHKLAAYEDRIVKFRGHECGSNVLEENCGVRWPRIYYTAQVKYTGTLTNRLLVESGLSINNESFSTGDPQESVKPGDIARRELTGVAGGAPAGALWGAPTTRNNRFPEIAKVLSGSMTYVTGSHAYRAGVQLGRGIEVINQTVGEPGINDLVQEYRNGIPSSVVVYNTPVINEVRSKYDLGIYVQDTWTMKRLTVNPGIRFEFFDSYYAEQSAPAGRFIGERHFEAEPERERPHWKDWAPRVGAVYDLFGNSRTALKASWGKYVGTYRAGFSSAYNPMTQSTDQRTWTDLNNDDIAQGDLSCDVRQAWGSPGCEIGRPANVLFGKVAARNPIPGIKRPYNTETAVSVQRQLLDGMSVSLGYTRRDYMQMIFTQNLATQPLGSPSTSGYTAVLVPDPRDPSLLPLTVYNLDPALKGLVNDLDQNSTNNKRWFNAWDLNVQARMFRGTLFGGASWGQQILVLCDVRDPNYISTTFGQNGLRFCDQSAFGMPYRGQYKVAATYPLPYGINVSGSLQSHPGGGATQSGGDGSQNINYNISAAAFRTLTGQTLTQTSVIVRLEQPGTIYLPRLNYADIRLAKRMDMGKYRVQVQFDAFNVTNANTVTGQTQTYGASYGRVSDIILGRVFAIGGTFSF